MNGLLLPELGGIMPELERTALYRLYDAEGRVLYIGISALPKARWERHSLIQTWWHLVARKSVEWYEDRPSALDAEAAATATEKPLYDKSWRHSQGEPRGGYDDSEGVKKVIDGLRRKIEQGECPAGTKISTGPISAEFGVSRTTAGTAMGVLKKNGLLQFRVPGRYLVI